jgi:hypothetical protein
LEKPTWRNLQWPNLYDFKDDPDQDMPKTGELIEKYCTRVSDLGIPLSENGLKILEWLEDEQEKRDQEQRRMYVCNDWNGWGMAEVFSNLVSTLPIEITTQRCH